MTADDEDSQRIGALCLEVERLEVIMPAQDWALYQQIKTLNERIAYLEPIRIAAQELVNNAEEYECDGLGLFAQHGWWEPLHDALDPDGSEAADDIRQPVAPAK